MSTRPETNEYDSLDVIIKALDGTLLKEDAKANNKPMPREVNRNMIWVANNYSLQDLVRDLRKLVK